MPKRKPRKIAMVGTAPSSAHAPIDDASWEIWGVGFRGDHITRCDRWFELHRLDGLRDGPEWRPLLREWGKDCELVMFWPEDLGPRILKYPLDAVKERFGTFFMTSSFSWMMALALHEHLAGKEVAEIGVWGVDMEFGTEYREQRAGLRHFLEMARFAGIATTLLVNGGVVYEPVPYPFWQDDPLLDKLALKHRTISAELGKARAAFKTTEMRLHQIDGARIELRRDGDPAARLQALDREAIALGHVAEKQRHDIAFAEGSIEAIEWQQDYLKP